MSLVPVSSPPRSRGAAAARTCVLAAETLAYDGGGERMIECTAHALRSGRPIRVLPIFEGGHLGRTADSLRASGIPVDSVAPFPHRIHGSSDLAPRRRWRLLTEYLIEHDVGAVLCYSLRGALRLARPCRRSKVPLLVSLHQTGPFFRSPLAAGKSWLARRILQQAVQRWLVLSDVARAELTSWGMPADRIRIIPNGLDLEAWRQDRVSTSETTSLRSRTAPEAGSLLIGVLARLHPLKSLDLAIDGLARLRASEPGARLAIAGGEAGDAPGHLEELRTLVRDRGVEDAVQFLGHLDDARPFLAACDVILQPSRQEASPLSILEALAMERPVVATAVGGVPELLGQGRHGWLIPPADPEALASALAEIHRDPAEARRRSRLGREHVLAHHDWRGCAAALEQEIAAAIG